MNQFRPSIVKWFHFEGKIMAKRQNPVQREKILNENIWRLMLTMSLPAIIAMSINGLNTFVDGLFVGQYVGQNALAAVSLVLPLTMITNGIAAMVGMGSASLLSIAIGGEDEDIQQKILGTSTLLIFIFSLLLTILGWSYAYELLAMMGGKGEIQELGVVYYRIMMLGSFFRIYAVSINMLIRAEGKVAEAMWYAIIATLLNIVLNAFLMIYLGMGVDGAAWATVIAMVVFSLLNFWYFYVAQKASFTVSLFKFSLERKMLGPIFSVGLSAMMLQFMFFVQQVVVFRSISYYGEDWDITFMGSCYRILLVVLMPGFGFAQALQPIIGINFGAKDYARVKKAFYVFMSSYTTLLVMIWLFVMLYPRVTLGWMMPEAHFTKMDIWNFWFMMVGLPLNPYLLMVNTLFQGIGHGRAATIILFSREVLLFVPVVLILPFWFGLPGIYATRSPVTLIIVIICYFMLQKRFNVWKKNSPEVLASAVQH